MHVCVIGSGASGLASCKYLLQNGFTCEVFERNEDLGGTWYYTEDTGEDKFGFPIYASMYSGLKTNLPKEVMCYYDYKYTTPEDRSYLSQEEVLAYFKSYAKDHNLRQHIKFLSPVIEVKPLPFNRWIIKTLHLPTKQQTIKEFDAVIICSGRFNEGLIPELPGIKVFQGQYMHSHEYRRPEPFIGKKLLVIGAGPSGLDVTLNLAKVAKYVIFSNHSKDIKYIKFPINVIVKPDVKLLTKFRAKFKDGSSEEIDWIVFCTGYKYKYPFLHENCKIIVEDNIFVKPLYKMIFNIEYPTMCFIGIPQKACSIPMYDLQIRYYMEYLKGNLHLPSKGKMYEDTAADIERRKKMGYKIKQFHLMNEDFVWHYYKDLADSAKIENIWPAITKLRLAGAKQITENLLSFRNDRFCEGPSTVKDSSMIITM